MLLGQLSDLIPTGFGTSCLQFLAILPVIALLFVLITGKIDYIRHSVFLTVIYYGFVGLTYVSGISLLLVIVEIAGLHTALGVLWLYDRQKTYAYRTQKTAQTTTLVCAKCGYNLRGQGQPRCSECGASIHGRQWDRIMSEQKVEDRKSE